MFSQQLQRAKCNSIFIIKMDSEGMELNGSLSLEKISLSRINSDSDQEDQYLSPKNDESAKQCRLISWNLMIIKVLSKNDSQNLKQTQMNL